MLISSHPAKGPALSKLKAENMHLLNQSQCLTLTKISDETMHKEVLDALSKLGVEAPKVGACGTPPIPMLTYAYRDTPLMPAGPVPQQPPSALPLTSIGSTT